MKRAALLTVLIMWAFFAATAPTQAALIIPTGVQNDVAYSTVTDDWGWTLLYRGDYGGSDLDIASTFAGAGDYIMLGAIQNGSSTIELLAAAPTADAMSYTALDTTHTLNGAEWYYNGFSMGFAGLGDMIQQNTADIEGPFERDRLSWHTGVEMSYHPTDQFVLPIYIEKGWRAGDNLVLGYNDAWDRLVFTANQDQDQDQTPAPEPLSLALWGSLSAIGVAFGAAQRRRA